MITLTNRIGGQLVCTLKSGKTLRLDNKQSATVQNSEITSHIENLIKKGLVTSEVVKEVEKPTQKKSKENVKEEKNNAKL